MSKDFFKFRESLLNEDIRKMSHSRLKFHATKNVPHGSYSRSEIEDEHERRKRTDGAEYAKAKATMNEEVELDEKAYVSSLSPELGRKGSHDVIGKDGKLVKSYPYTKEGMKAAQAHLSKMKESVELDEAAPKIKPDFVKTQREKDRAHDAAMGRTPTGRKKPVRQMTSTQKSLASMRKEEVELDEVTDDDQTIHKMLNSQSSEKLLNAYKKLYKSEYSGTSKSELVSKIKSKVRNYKQAYELMKEEVELDEAEMSLYDKIKAARKNPSPDKPVRGRGSKNRNPKTYDVRNKLDKEDDYTQDLIKKRLQKNEELELDEATKKLTGGQRSAKMGAAMDPSERRIPKRGTKAYAAWMAKNNERRKAELEKWKNEEVQLDEDLNAIAKDHDAAAKKHSSAYKETKSYAAARNHEVAYNRHADAAKAHREAANDKSKHSSEKLKKMSNHAWDATDHIRKHFDESVELDEVSDKKLDAYRQKAFADQPSGDDGSDKYRKRKFGRDLAFAKQTGRAKVLATKEEVELDEVLDTPKAMDSYRNKAKYSKDRAANSAAAKMLRNPKGFHSTDTSDELNTMDKRTKGLKMADRAAARKTRAMIMKKEEVDLDEGLGHISAIQNMMAKEREAQAKKKYTAPTQAEIDADRKKDQRGKSRPSMSAKSVTRKTYGNMMGGLKKEEAEQLDELSPNKLHAYIKGASKDLAKRSRMSGYDDKRGNYADGDKNRKRANKRMAGIASASGRLADKANMAEEYVNEKLKVSHGMGAWVDDFKKSDAPQFKGKSDKERRDMAVAAYLSAKRGQKEEYASDAQRKAVWASRAEKGKK